MTFPQVSKYLAIVLLILGVIGSFFLAEELSTSTQLVPKYEYITSDKMELREIKDDKAYNLILASSWVGSLVLCLFLYGIGLIVEELRQGNTYQHDILKNIKNSRKENT